MIRIGGFVRKVLSKLDPAEFMNDYQEWHAFWEGVAEGFCPWLSRFEPDEKLQKNIESEHHYYAFGMVIGFAGFIFAMAGAFRMVVGVFL